MYIYKMKAIVDNWMLSLNSLIDVEVILRFNEDKLNRHPDYSAVNKLYWIFNKYSVETLTEIVNKLGLGNPNYPYMEYSVWSVWGYLFDAKNHTKVYKALYKYYQSENVGELILKLQELAFERRQLLDHLLNAA